MHRRTFVVALATAILFTHAISAQGEYAAPDSKSSARGEPEPGEGDQAQAHRQREGTRLADQRGYFRGSGDGLIFHLRDSKEKYPALANLALERVGKVLSDRHDHPDQLNWTVSGFFTEYRGSNYIFITHVVLESKNRRRSALP